MHKHKWCLCKVLALWAYPRLGGAWGDAEPAGQLTLLFPSLVCLKCHSWWQRELISRFSPCTHPSDVLWLHQQWPWQCSGSMSPLLYTLWAEAEEQDWCCSSYAAMEWELLWETRMEQDISSWGQWLLGHAGCLPPSEACAGLCKNN